MPPTESPTEGPETGLPGIDESTTPGPLLTSLPASNTAQGRLVEDFPAFLRPTPKSIVTNSSVSASTPWLQVSLVATTSHDAEAVLRRYRTRLSAVDMREQEAPAAVGTSEAVAFARGDSLVTITVDHHDDQTTYSVFGVLRVQG